MGLFPLAYGEFVVKIQQCAQVYLFFCGTFVFTHYILKSMLCVH